jgi:hypothetical protein
MSGSHATVTEACDELVRRVVDAARPRRVAGATTPRA